MSDRSSTPSRPIKNKTLIAGGLIVGMLLGLLASVIVGTKYTASASVLVRAISAQPFDPADATEQLSMNTEARLAGSDGVAARAAGELGIDQSVIVNGLNVGNPADTALLTFAFTSADPETAADVANGMAAAYLADRLERTQVTMSNIEESLIREEQRLKRRIERLAGLNDTAARQVQLSVLTEQLAEVRARAVDIESLDSSPGYVVSPAVPPASPSSPSIVTWIVVGILLGLGLGLLLIWLRPAWEPYVLRDRSRADVDGSSGDTESSERPPAE